MRATLLGIKPFFTDPLKPHSRAKPYQAAHSTIWESDPADSISTSIRKRCFVADLHAYQRFGRTIFLGVNAGTTCPKCSSWYFLSKRLWRTQFFDDHCSSGRRDGYAQGSSHLGFGSTVQHQYQRVSLAASEDLASAHILNRTAHLRCTLPISPKH